MPYFIYNIHPNKRLELVEDYPKYRDARNAAREMRSKLNEEDDYIVKVIHAKHPEEAERVLKQERKPRPLGEDA
jgi:hypothetical protein